MNERIWVVMGQPYQNSDVLELIKAFTNESQAEAYAADPFPEPKRWGDETVYWVEPVELFRD